MSTSIASVIPQVEVANIWRHSIDLAKYTPPISQEDSLNYAVAGGLALDS